MDGWVGSFLVHYKMFSLISGLSFLDTRSKLPSNYGNQNCLQTLIHVLRGQNHFKKMISYFCLDILSIFCILWDFFAVYLCLLFTYSMCCYFVVVTIYLLDFVNLLTFIMTWVLLHFIWDLFFLSTELKLDKSEDCQYWLKMA